MGRLPVIADFDTNIVIDVLSGVGAANVEDIRHEHLLLRLLCDTAVL